MKQFVLAPASFLNKQNTTKSTTLKKDLPKYQPQQTPTSQVDSLKKDITKKLFAKADSLVNELLASPRIKLSLSNTIVVDGIDTGVMLHDFAQHLRKKNADVTDIYFTLLDAADISPSIVLNQNARAKEIGNWTLSKSERQKLRRLYTGPAAYGSVRNLAEASKRPFSQVRQFLHSKDSYTIFTLATRKFRRMTAFARYKNEIWCMDLAYVDKLTKDNRGIKYLLVRLDVFDNRCERIEKNVLVNIKSFAT